MRLTEYNSVLQYAVFKPTKEPKSVYCHWKLDQWTFLRRKKNVYFLSFSFSLPHFFSLLFYIHLYLSIYYLMLLFLAPAPPGGGGELWFVYFRCMQWKLTSLFLSVSLPVHFSFLWAFVFQEFSFFGIFFPGN